MRKFKYILSLLLVATMGTSCSNYVDGLLDDPNNASDGPLNGFVRTALSVSIIAHEGEDTRLGCIWAQQFTGSALQYSGYNIYNITAQDFDWDNKYYGTIQNAELAIEKAEEVDNRLVIGIMQIVKAHTFALLAAGYGDIPFAEANKFMEFPDPLYDDQMSVYTGVLSLIDEAIVNLESNIGTTAGDFVYEGDAAKWIQVANTLKARLYLHTGDYTSAITAAESGILDAADSYNALHIGGSYNGDVNVWYSFQVLDRPGDMTANNAYLPQLLDTRKTIYRGNDKTDESARFQYMFGDLPDDGSTYDLNIDDGMFTSTSSYPLITYEENLLILAETKLRNSDTDGALEELNELRSYLATKFGATYDDYVMADFETGGIEHIDGSTAENALLMEIIEERYVTLAAQMEVFNDLRRTDNMLGLSPTSGSQFPKRFLYPQDELNTNDNAPDPIPGLFETTDLFQ
ncbi:SusD/RagB family nutrient-binding outer membrane lipoprotein [Chondrinema litorale]|uniref:SusD/RagB family nutrient-binding outer membrane lipoprotein n=1 Tax=Chondrinema litorale TaxID=2994555 RepID=UPI002543A67D|nr:SusD/RagB family nutrient-binding outer membrane lipoprotein [Chondrinema litorale]UZR97675.1 SusD/RagB family nutrient-binding outer membrane lipoprotein [Chondrinema litorale]